LILEYTESEVLGLYCRSGRVAAIAPKDGACARWGIYALQGAPAGGLMQ